MRLVYPAADGYVSITHVFGAPSARRTARADGVGLRGGALRRGDCATRTGSTSTTWWPAATRRSRTWEAAKAAVEQPDLLAHQGRTAGGGHAAPTADRADRGAGRRDRPARNFATAASSPGRAPGRPGGRSRCPVPSPSSRRCPLLRSAPRPASASTRRRCSRGRPAGRTRPSAAPPESAGGAGAGPLAGLKVLDFTWSIAGPHDDADAGRLRRHGGQGGDGEEARRRPGLPADVRQRARASRTRRCSTR